MRDLYFRKRIERYYLINSNELVEFIIKHLFENLLIDSNSTANITINETSDINYNLMNLTKEKSTTRMMYHFHSEEFKVIKMLISYNFARIFISTPRLNFRNE